MKNLRESRKAAFEGELRGLDYNAQMLLEAWEELVNISQQLNKLSSPRIKGKEESMYSKSVAPPTDNIIELIEKEGSVRRRYDYYEEAVNHVAHFLQKLEPEELDLIIQRYEQNRTLEQISHNYFTSHKVIIYKLNRILEKADN